MADSILFQSLTAQANQALTASLQKETETHETTYLGYGKRGVTSLDQPFFSICRIQTDKETKTTTFTWAGGTLERKFPFSHAENLEYSFLK